MILILGALLGFFSVAFGAYAEHGLREAVTDEQFRYLMTAVRYNQVNSVAIITIGLALQSGKFASIPAFFWSGLFFIIGTMLFSFSIYVSVSFDIPRLLNITPIGGIIIMIAWLTLTFAAVMVRRKAY